MKSCVFFILMMSSFILYSQNDSIKWQSSSYKCGDGIKSAVTDANNKKFKLLSYGLIVSSDWEFDEFYWDFVQKKYGITLGLGGCIVSESINCYNKKMKELIFKEFGDDIFEKAKKEAKELYLKSKNN